VSKSIRQKAMVNNPDYENATVCQMTYTDRI